MPRGVYERHIAIDTEQRITPIPKDYEDDRKAKEELEYFMELHEMVERMNGLYNRSASGTPIKNIQSKLKSMLPLYEKLSGIKHFH